MNSFSSHCWRTGRPQFDKEAVAVIMCEESKKNFLKKFLYEPFPVECEFWFEIGRVIFSICCAHKLLRAFTLLLSVN